MEGTIAASGHSHEQDHVRANLRVFVALLVLTILEYLYARFFSHHGFVILLSGLLGLAMIKAALVGMFFMHLAFEGRWKYLILLPTLFLVAVLVAALYPDMAYDAPRLDPARVGGAPIQEAAATDATDVP